MTGIELDTLTVHITSDTHVCRWFINLALDAATRMFKINCSVDSEDLCLVGTVHIHCSCNVMTVTVSYLYPFDLRMY